MRDDEKTLRTTVIDILEHMCQTQGPRINSFRPVGRYLTIITTGTHV